MRLWTTDIQLAMMYPKDKTRKLIKGLAMILKLLKKLDDKIPLAIKCPLAVMLFATMMAYTISYFGKFEVKRKMADVNNTPEFNLLCERVLFDGYVGMVELETVRKNYIDQ